VNWTRESERERESRFEPVSFDDLPVRPFSLRTPLASLGAPIAPLITPSLSLAVASVYCLPVTQLARSHAAFQTALFAFASREAARFASPSTHTHVIICVIPPASVPATAPAFSSPPFPFFSSPATLFLK